MKFVKKSRITLAWISFYGIMLVGDDYAYKV